MNNGVLVSAEEKEFVFDDGAADGAAETVVIISRLREDRSRNRRVQRLVRQYLCFSQVVEGVEVLVLGIPLSRPVQVVGAGLGDQPNWPPAECPSIAAANSKARSVADVAREMKTSCSPVSCQ